MQGASVIGGARLRLAVPWLAAAARSRPGGSSRLPAAEWLLARAERLAGPGADWRQWLIAGSGLGGDLLQRLPAGPCVHAAQHGSLPNGTWACARPVHLLTGLDHLQLSAAWPELDEEEGAALLADVNRHLAGTGMRFHPSRNGDWLLECAQSFACTAVEPEWAAGRNLRELMPGGPDGVRVRSLMNELQMLLHEHPVNERRERRGDPSVNSLWLWGFGVASPPDATALSDLYTDDPWLEGIWRAHGAAARPLAEFGRGADAGRTGLLGWSSTPAASADACLARSESLCFVHARSALQDGRVDGIDLLAGEPVFAVARRASAAFWKRARPLAEVLA